MALKYYATGNGGKRSGDIRAAKCQYVRMSGMLFSAVTGRWRTGARSSWCTLVMAIGLGLAIVVTAACGGKSTGSRSPETNQPAQADAGIILVRAISIVWVLETIEETADDAARTRVSIAITNETGSTRHELVGVFEGGCKDIGAEISGAGVLLALACKEAKRGAVLHAVKRQSGLVFLRAHVYEGESELSFDVLKTFPLPAGALVKVGE